MSLHAQPFAADLPVVVRQAGGRGTSGNEGRAGREAREAGHDGEVLSLSGHSQAPWRRGKEGVEAGCQGGRSAPVDVRVSPALTRREWLGGSGRGAGRLHVWQAMLSARARLSSLLAVRCTFSVLCALLTA